MKELPTNPVVKDLASQRIDELMRLAISTAPQDLDLANRYVDMAVRLATRHRVRLTREWNRIICRSCRAILIPGRTSRVRVRQNRGTHMAVTCQRCGAIRRYGCSKR